MHLHFFQVGHTHLDIDRRFSFIAVGLRKTHIVTQVCSLVLFVWPPLESISDSAMPLQQDLERIIMTTKGESDPEPHIVRVGSCLPKNAQDTHVSLLDEIPDVKGCVGPSVTRVTGIAKPHYVLFQSVGGATRGYCKPWPESPDYYPRAGHQFVNTPFPATRLLTSVPFRRSTTTQAQTLPLVCR